MSHNEEDDKFVAAFKDELLADNYARVCLSIDRVAIENLQKNVDTIFFLVAFASFAIYVLSQRVIALEERIGRLELSK